MSTASFFNSAEYRFDPAAMRFHLSLRRTLRKHRDGSLTRSRGHPPPEEITQLLTGVDPADICDRVEE